MKKQIAAVLLASSLTLGASAAPFLAAGDGAELFLTAMVGVRADDNIYLSGNGLDDTIFDINPGVEFVFGQLPEIQGPAGLLGVTELLLDPGLKGSAGCRCTVGESNPQVVGLLKPFSQ